MEPGPSTARAPWPVLRTLFTFLGLAQLWSQLRWDWASREAQSLSGPVRDSVGIP